MQTLIALFCFFALSAASLQRISVKGKLTCQSDPEKARLAHIKLIDEDTGPNPDDLLEERLPEPSGDFTVSGQTSEMGRIDPVLKIYHDCNDKKLGVEVPCQRRYKIEIPKRFINKDTPFDAGVINLDMKDSNEERDCSH